MTNDDLKKYRTNISTIERSRFVGPMWAGDEVLKTLHAYGWHITRAGPYTNKKMHPKMDMTRFLFIAERETKEAT